MDSLSGPSGPRWGGAGGGGEGGVKGRAPRPASPLPGVSAPASQTGTHREFQEGKGSLGQKAGLEGATWGHQTAPLS